MIKTINIRIISPVVVHRKKNKSLTYVTPQMLYLGFAEKYILSIYLVAKVKTKKKIGVSMHLSEQ